MSTNADGSHSFISSLEKLRNAIPISSEKWNEYRGHFTCIQVPAKTISLHEGEISRKAFLVEKGCIRAWFNNNGEEITFQFFFENSTVSSIESFKKNIPGMFVIETIEPSTLWVIEKTDVEQLVNEPLSTGKRLVIEM